MKSIQTAMRHLMLILAASLMLSPMVFANSTRDAQFYLNSPEKYKGKQITLYAAFVTRRGKVPDLNGVEFLAYTMSRDGDQTSYISVLVPNAKADSFARRYGTDFKYQNGSPRKLSMRGFLREIDDTWFLEIEE